MRETLDRFQLLWPKRQRQVLTRLARERGVTLTEMARQAIDIGIRELEQEDEFKRRGKALEEADRLRAKILARNGGKPLDVDVAEDLRQMRDERIEQLTSDH